MSVFEGKADMTLNVTGGWPERPIEGWRANVLSAHYRWIEMRPQSGRTTMLTFIRASKLFAAVLMTAAVLAGASTESRAQTGTVRLHIVKAGFIVGVGGGSGTLTYHGRHYRLSIGGIGIGSLGIAAVDLVGTAHNLRSPADIAGTYGAAGAGAAFVGGAQVARLQNDRGVILEVRGVQVGFQVSIGLAGMTIALR
jgi:hypothetical protein